MPYLYDTGFIEDGEIEIGKEPFADTYLFAIVAVKRLVDEKVIICQHLLFLCHTLNHNILFSVLH